MQKNNVARRPYAWLFPGQGAQYVGMGKDLLAISATAREIFARADDALGMALSTLILEGPVEALMATENAQPALLTISIAFLEALRERVSPLPMPVMAAGHSLGEYTAWVAAGALRFEDAIQVVHARGQAMREACPEGGAMAAILGLDANEVDALCREGAEGEVVGPANFNAPGQIVIAGHAKAVARVMSLVEKQRGKAIPLSVSGPFHCSLMHPAANKLTEILSTVPFAEPRFPVVTNVDAMPHKCAGDISSLLVRQVSSPVRWVESVAVLHQEGVRHAVEIGPGKVLAGLIKRAYPNIYVWNLCHAEALSILALSLEPALKHMTSEDLSS